MRLLHWLARHDRDYAALRRAGRAAIVMPAMFAVGDAVIGNGQVATFAAFGSFAMVLLVDFGGSIRERLQSQAALALAGAVLVCLGTLTAQNVWVAALAMAVVGFAVIFAGVVSSVLAGATTALLLAFILPVSLTGPVSALPDRLAGWGMAAAAAFLAVGLLWPAPVRDPLRAAAAHACRAMAARLRAEVAYILSERETAFGQDHARAVEQADAAVTTLHGVFLGTPYRPTGLSTTNRAVVRLVDEVGWLSAIVGQSEPGLDRGPMARSACQVKVASWTVLDRAADLLETTAGDGAQLESAVHDLDEALRRAERQATAHVPLRQQIASPGGVDQDESIHEVLTALDPSFRAQELSFAVSLIARNVAAAAAAERRGWLDRVLGRQPDGVSGPLSAAQQRAVAHVERHSVWLHNSVRAAVGLGLAVLVARLSGVGHSFWVVLGTLSVLRSNALNTGESALRGLLGTVAGFVVGALILAVIGTNPAVLWILLPLVILVAGVAPAAISFAAGQAGFTLTLVILFNIIQPTGWRIGLLRVEDIALGCAVSLAVGLLFWPRGAGSALRRALAEAYTDSAGYLAAAVDFGVSRCDRATSSRPAPAAETLRAAASSRRLDDAFREYLAERGTKPLRLSQVTSLVTGVAGLRLAADAVLDLWERDDGVAVNRATATRELLASTTLVTGWYKDLGTRLIDRDEPPDPLGPDLDGDRRLVEAVSQDLRDEQGRATATAVRIIWTGDHLDAARRLQSTVHGPARTAAAAAARDARRLGLSGRRLGSPIRSRRAPTMTREQTAPAAGSGE